MNTLIQSIKKVFHDAIKSFKTFPASMTNALGFALVTIIRIHLDWEFQRPYNFIFNSLHLSMALGALFSLMSITYARRNHKTDKSLLVANILGMLSTLISFLALYFFAGSVTKYSDGYKLVSSLWVLRMSVLMLISLLGFMVAAEDSDRGSDFSKSLFMTMKSFFIASLYGSVLIGGASIVAGAIQTLLYNDMSTKVYMYISTLGGLVAFAIFLGYFPSFNRDTDDPHRELAETQPRFIRILFGSIMVPLMLALTVVLLLWTIKTAINGIKASFIQLSSIASAFAYGGIWLYMMLTDHESNLAKFYKKIYPYATILILAFEAWALVEQLSSSGLKTPEYSFGLMWIVAISSAILLIIMKEKSYNIIAAIVSLVALISVLPLVGYNVLPARAQTGRLEKLLLEEGILENNIVTPTKTEPNKDKKIAITDAVYFLNSQEDIKLPVWYPKDTNNSLAFKNALGFEPILREDDYIPPDHDTDIMSTMISLPYEPINIERYRWTLSLEGIMNTDNLMLVNGERGLYKFNYVSSPTDDDLPRFTVELDGNTIMEANFKSFIDGILKKYPLRAGKTVAKNTMEDVTLRLESTEVDVMLVFQHIDINLYVKEDRIFYYMTPDSIYFSEKL